MNQKIKIGILTNSHAAPAWAFKMLEKIVNSNHSEIILVVRNQSHMEGASHFLDKIWKNKHHILWKLYTKLENMLFKPLPNAFEKKEISEIVKCDELVVAPNAKNGSEYFAPVDLDKMRDYGLDVLINLCDFGLKGDIFAIPKFGVWSHRHSIRILKNKSISGVWEVFEQCDITGATVEVRTEKNEEGRILARTFSSTDKLSFIRNRNNHFWKSSSLIPRKLNELFKYGEAKFYETLKKENGYRPFLYDKCYDTPTNKEVLKAFFKIYSKKLSQTFNSLFYFNQWIILYRFHTDDKWPNEFYKFKRIKPPKDRFWADPFVLYRDGKYYVFLEELVYSEKLGKIAVAEIDDNGNLTTPITILKKEYHLSYPFLIEENNELFMIPESSGNNTIQLYKCTEFPLKWELSKILMHDVCAVDSTVFKHNNMYWLFCNIKENKGASSLDELFLFFSESLQHDDWISHPDNPIISDVRQSRPAGKIFVENGKIYRPCQNSAKHYGHGMRINEIVELTTTTYKEKTIQSIDPNWENDLLSTHTLNRCNNLTVIDAMIQTGK